jgi:uncharacterized membrane protein YjjP (DUF1212 family)
MPEEEDRTGVPEEADRQGVPLVGQVVEKTQVIVETTTRFSREFVATMISLASAAFGVVAALAWNTAITTIFDEYLTGKRSRVSALLIYAVIVTLIGVTVIVLLGRLATRINAEPVEFKYPGVPKSS